MTDDLDTAETAAPEQGGAASEPPRARRTMRRVLAGLAIAVGGLVVLAGLLFAFGGMERPSPETQAAFDQMVAEGRAAPVERRFVIPIPGCRCHSDDPVLTMAHSVRRIRECSGCHAR